MSRDEFRDSLQLPLARNLEFDGLWQFGSFTNAATNGQPERMFRKVISSKIRYAVLCYGVPLKIAPDPGPARTHRPGRAARIPPQRGRRGFRTRLAAAGGNESSAFRPAAELGLRRHQRRADESHQRHPAWSRGWMGRAPTSRSGLVDKAVQAERDGLWGRAYFDARGLTKADTNYFLGDEWILGAAEICRATRI